MNYHRLLLYTTIFAAGLVLSCDIKEPKPDCGCESKEIIGTIIDGKASLIDKSLFAIYDDKRNQIIGLFYACNPDPAWKNSEKDVYDYIISGKYKRQCLPPNTLPYIPNYPIEVTKVISSNNY